MELHEVLQAIENGETVKWKNSRYSVIKDKLGQILIKDVYNGFCNKLTDTDLNDCFV